MSSNEKDKVVSLNPYSNGIWIEHQGRAARRVNGCWS